MSLCVGSPQAAVTAVNACSDYNAPWVSLISAATSSAGLDHKCSVRVQARTRIARHASSWPASRRTSATTSSAPTSRNSAPSRHVLASVCWARLWPEDCLLHHTRVVNHDVRGGSARGAALHAQQMTYMTVCQSFRLCVHAGRIHAEGCLQAGPPRDWFCHLRVARCCRDGAHESGVSACQGLARYCYNL